MDRGNPQPKTDGHLLNDIELWMVESRPQGWEGYTFWAHLDELVRRLRKENWGD